MWQPSLCHTFHWGVTFFTVVFPNVLQTLLLFRFYHCQLLQQHFRQEPLFFAWLCFTCQSQVTLSLCTMLWCFAFFRCTWLAISCLCCGLLSFPLHTQAARILCLVHHESLMTLQLSIAADITNHLGHVAVINLNNPVAPYSYVLEYRWFHNEGEEK